MATKVLTIDDESSFTSLIRMNLERDGEYSVREENDPLFAVESAQEFLPDVILLDMVMPGMDGVETASALSSDPELGRIPVIMMTAMVSRHEATDTEFFIPQVQKVLPKPVQLATLKEAIAEVVAMPG